MSTSIQRGRTSARTLTTRLGGVTVASALCLGVLGAAPATAGPIGGPPAVGAGEVYLTSAVETTSGQRLSFAGEGFVSGGAGAFQGVSAQDRRRRLLGLAVAPNSGVTTAQVQADGPVRQPCRSRRHRRPGGELERRQAALAARPGWGTRGLAVDRRLHRLDRRRRGPVVTATAATTTGRGSGVTITVAGTGFAPNEAVSVARSTGTPYQWTVGTAKVDTITANASGVLSGSLRFAIGELRAGEYQLVFGAATPAVAQVTVKPAIAFTGLAVGSDGTVTVSNAATGSTFSSVKIDDPAVEGDEVELAVAPFTANDAGVATGTVRVPAGLATGTKSIVVGQTTPYAATFNVSAKLSPSSALLGVDRYARVETAPGVIEQGLYQSAYSDRSDALFATTANVLATSTLYRLDPDTLAVEDSVVPAANPAAAGTIWAAYGVGVDDDHGTVWVTNTRQNTVAVYDQDTLDLVKQFPAGIVSHTRDVIYDPSTGKVFVTSASEGSSGNGTIAVFDAETLEQTDTIDLGLRTYFSPMSLELDAASGKLYSISLLSPRAVEIDTTTLEPRFIELDADKVDRGSGIGYDADANKLFVTSQNLDNVLIADATTGETVANVPTGAQALNVAIDQKHDLAYVANFGGSTVTVIDLDGNIVANLPHTRSNHITEDGKGSVYSVNKDANNSIVKLTPSTTSAKPDDLRHAQVGKKLTAKAGAWTDGATFTYQWKRGAASIGGATRSSYTPVAADAGKAALRRRDRCRRRVRAASATSASTKAVARGVLSGAKPKVTGSAVIGKRLTAVPGTWTSGTTLTYQWLANGKAVKGAKAKQLKVTKALKGKKLTVRVTGTKAGYTTKATTSAATRPVKKK